MKTLVDVSKDIILHDGFYHDLHVERQTVLHEGPAIVTHKADPAHRERS